MHTPPPATSNTTDDYCRFPCHTEQDDLEQRLLTEYIKLLVYQVCVLCTAVHLGQQTQAKERD